MSAGVEAGSAGGDFTDDRHWNEWGDGSGEQGASGDLFYGSGACF